MDGKCFDAFCRGLQIIMRVRNLLVICFFFDGTVAHFDFGGFFSSYVLFGLGSLFLGLGFESFTYRCCKSWFILIRAANEPS